MPNSTVATPPLIPTLSTWLKRLEPQEGEGRREAIHSETNFPTVMLERWPKPQAPMQRYTW